MDESLAREFQKFIEKVVETRSAGALAAPAPVQAVHEDGTVMVSVNGRTVAATMATEEPVTARELAWVSRTKDGRYIVHGGRIRTRPCRPSRTRRPAMSSGSPTRSGSRPWR